MKSFTKSIRIPTEQWLAIELQMQSKGLNFTEFALLAMLDKDKLQAIKDKPFIPPKPQKTTKKQKHNQANQELIIELAKWGNNLNQVAKHLNTTKGGLDRVGLEMLGRIEAHLQEIRVKYDC